MTNILIINGPNLNMLGEREPEIYGSKSLDEIMDECVIEGNKLGFSVSSFQSNVEGELVGQIQDARGKYAAIIINAAAYTHTSVAIHDALKAFEGKIIEVHLSNIYKREEFRHKSYISPVADGIICGFGGQTYLLAINSLNGVL